MLNYIAVVKAAKKRNRLMEEAFGGGAEALDPLSVLSQQPFFTSNLLAQLSTQAEVVSREALPDWQLSQLRLLDDFSCPVCLGVLHDPVILSCAHRFCWGCVVAHCADQVLSRQRRSAAGSQEGRGSSEPGGAGTSGTPPSLSRGDGASEATVAPPAPAAREPAPSPPGGTAAAPPGVEAGNTFDCPVCRKPQIIDDAGLKVDEGLGRFVERLQNLYLSDQGPKEALAGQAGAGAGAGAGRPNLSTRSSRPASTTSSACSRVAHPAHSRAHPSRTMRGTEAGGEPGTTIICP